MMPAIRTLSIGTDFICRPFEDGATEEGSPIIPVGQSHLYSFTPKPTGTRWYHSHAMAMTDLTRSTYSGEFGFLIVEPAAGDPGRYDREVLLAARRWEGEWVSMQDLRKGPPPDNGLEVMYHSATLGERMLGHDEPIRVRQGERILFRLLNASATMDVTLALPGHQLHGALRSTAIPVPTQASVEVLKLDVAERADVIVEMNNPGVWVFGSTDDDDRNYGDGSRHRIRQQPRASRSGWRRKNDLELCGVCFDDVRENPGRDH